MTKKKEKLLTHLEVCVALGVRQPITLTNWYKWEANFGKPENWRYPPLPEPIMEGRTRYWRESDLPKLKAFQKWMPRGNKGVMAKVTHRHDKNYPQYKPTKED